MKAAESSIEVRNVVSAEYSRILNPEALSFLEKISTPFLERRKELLERRRRVQHEIDAGKFPDFLPETKKIREGTWKVAPIPKDLLERRVEITGPVDRKMVINALNSGANVFMADFEDSHSPTWEGTLQGQVNMMDAVRRTISLKTPEKNYQLNDKIATLLVRPRGWHLVEKNVFLNGEPMPGSLFDFGLFFFHNAKEQLKRGTGPYFYLPKMESHLEARLWNDIFNVAQDELGIPRGSIKATVLIETILAAFEMDEIIYELRDHMAGLNCGRWDYIFSYIKKFRKHPEFLVGDRKQVVMTQHFLKSYCELLVQTCHKRGAFAMGGMAAQIPIKNDEAANAAAMDKVLKDKEREVTQGFDGTWVAHPALVAIAKKAFDEKMKGPNQLGVLREDVKVTAKDLLQVPEAQITEEGCRTNISVGVLYLEAWLRGQGCVPIHNLMEDAATAEISRAQLWQWVRNGRLSMGDFKRYMDEELDAIQKKAGPSYSSGRYELAAKLFYELTADVEFKEFLTLRGYEFLDQKGNGMSNLSKAEEVRTIEESWKNDARWKGIRRSYKAENVYKLRGTVKVEYTLARMGAERLRKLLQESDKVCALGALTGNMALQQVEAGLQAIYLSGWQVAADANLSGHMYPDQSLYPVDSVPNVVRKINQAFTRADQIQHAEGKPGPYWFAPIVADAEAGFGGNLNAFELMKMMIEAGAAAVHWEDQLASAKKCGHMGGKVLVPTQEAVQKLNAARLASDVMGVPTLIVARTDANGAHLITSDVDSRDKKFITGEKTAEGFFKMKGGLDAAIARGLAYAPYADIVWCETAHPDVAEAKRFAEAIHAEFPGKWLAYNCSPSFNWKKHLDDKTIATFQEQLASMGYKFQFVTLAGFHSLNYSMFELSRLYKNEGMGAYSRFQQMEFDSEKNGYRATSHQRFVGTGYFDQVAQAIAAGELSTAALKGSTEEEQFEH